MSGWDALPDDLVRLILALRREAMVTSASARRIQANWRRYRITTLLERFRMLRYLLQFREWNPSASIFLNRTRI